MPQEPLENKGPDPSKEKVTHSLFLLGAVLFHLLIFLAVAGWILFPGAPPPAPDLVGSIKPTPPPPAPKVEVPISPVNPPLASAEFIHSSSNDPFAASHLPNIDIRPHIPDPGTVLVHSDTHRPTPQVSPSSHGPNPRLEKLRKTVLEDWHMSPEDLESGNAKAQFVVYVAQYANGDWASDSKLDKDGNIVAGSIPNLMAKITEWSHGDIKGELVPRPLDVASQELIDKMPPFVFFTGHKDFVLTDKEVENLRTYLNDGGCIWGDNALAGEGSRFDVAFHREMKRVVPDLDKNFKPYSLNDDIFNKGRYHLDEIPKGMNYYAEMPQHLDIDGDLAILYTPNDYSDMLFMRILPGDTSFFMSYKPIPPGTLYTDTAFVEKRDIFYRNFDLKTSLAVHHMGMDIVTYLLLRFRDKLMLPP
jgi:hypothetical protein